MNDDTGTVTEVFDIPLQKRIMKTSLISTYQSVVKLIEEGKLVESNESEFYEKLSQMIDFLDDL